MTFWTDTATFEPKRRHTFLFSIAGKTQSIENYLIKKVTRPSFEVSKSEHKFLNHTFYFPGRVKWKEVKFTIVDAIDPNGAKKFLQMLEESGYRAPEGPVEAGLPTAQTVSKKRSLEALGQPIIRQINHDGETIEEWVLRGAWVQDADFQELNNDEEDLMAIDVTLAYDYAYINVIKPDAARIPSNAF